jgi:nucleotide-binding universal stress UspA family protein
MKNILALIGGGPRDQVIFETALAAAMPCVSHVNFLHIHVNAGEAAVGSPTEFARGPALRSAMQELDGRAKSYSRIAAHHIREFCENSVVPMGDMAGAARRNGVTASYLVETGRALERLTANGMRNDLIVMGRLKQTQGLPSLTLEYLIKRSGRPMLIASSGPPRKLTGTAIVFWNGSENAARAVEGAKPILSKAKRVVVATILKSRKQNESALAEIVRKLVDCEIKAEPLSILADGRGIAIQLASAADECDADLLVMGAYGRGIARELLFGSRTEAVLHKADKPILLMH